MGVSCEICFIDDDPTEEQAALFERLIFSMRDLPTEYLIFDFLNAENGPDMQQGLVFCQMCRQGNRIRTEVRVDVPGERRMYAKLMKAEEAAGLVRGMIRTRNAPDLTEWEDITEQAFSEPDDAEFE